MNKHAKPNQQTSIFFEYNTQIFQMTLLNVKMINGTSSSPVTDFKKQLVVNNYLCKVLIDTDTKVRHAVYIMKLKGIKK